ncbi:DUF2071 domain-containing protein [Azospirillaceae bacterium]
MKLICYPTSGPAPTIRPAPVDRAWMDNTADRFAYRCLPLSIANAHGWEILSPCAFSARWNGGDGRDAITVSSRACPSLLPVSHFGYGILTFHVLAMFRTEPGYNLWVSGPSNLPKDGIVALAGVIETDWAPSPFTMNWKFTRPGVEVAFEEGEPFCFFFPVVRGLLDATEPEIHLMSEHSDVERQYLEWSASRSQFLDDLAKSDPVAQRAGWQKDYFRGVRPDGEIGVSDHKTKIRPKPFRTKDENNRE